MKFLPQYPAEVGVAVPGLDVILSRSSTFAVGAGGFVAHSDRVEFSVTVLSRDTTANPWLASAPRSDGRPRGKGGLEVVMDYGDGGRVSSWDSLLSGFGRLGRRRLVLVRGDGGEGVWIAYLCVYPAPEEPIVDLRVKWEEIGLNVARELEMAPLIAGCRAVVPLEFTD